MQLSSRWLCKLSDHDQSFNPPIFTTNGVIPPECTKDNKRLAEKIAKNIKEPYCMPVINYMQQSSDLHILIILSWMLQTCIASHALTHKCSMYLLDLYILGLHVLIYFPFLLWLMFYSMEYSTSFVCPSSCAVVLLVFLSVIMCCCFACVNSFTSYYLLP